MLLGGLWRLSAGDGVAVGVIDGHNDVHTALDLRSVRKAVRLEQRGGRNAVTSRERVQRITLGDDDRRTADGGPPDRRSDDGLRSRGGSALTRGRHGGRLRDRRGGHARSRRCVGRLIRKRIGEGTAALGEACDVGRASRQQQHAEPSQREARVSTQFRPRNAITHRLLPTPTQLQIRAVCSDRVKGRFKMNRW